MNALMFIATATPSSTVLDNSDNNTERDDGTLTIVNNTASRSDYDRSGNSDSSSVQGECT